MIYAQIDLDGVICQSGKGYVKNNIYQKPMKGALRTIKNILKQGHKIEILTSRGPEEWDSVRGWLKKYNFPELAVTNIKKPARFYIDNRAIRFINWADIAYYLL